MEMKAMSSRFARALCAAALVLAACGGSEEPVNRMPQAGAAAGEPATSPQARMQQMADELLAASPGISSGDPTAPFVVYELSDFQCPACRMAATQSLRAFKQAYVETGRVRFVFVDSPLVNIHPNAFPAARATRCALE